MQNTDNLHNRNYQDLLYLMRCFEQMLRANNAQDLAEKLPWIHQKQIHDAEHIPINFRKRDVQLYSMAFQLLNLVEINQAIDQRNTKANQTNMGLINGLWSQCLESIKQTGTDLKSCLKVLPQIVVMTVLTPYRSQTHPRTRALPNFSSAHGPANQPAQRQIKPKPN